MNLHVALFRNLNLGHAGCPTGAQLADVFGGPPVAHSFQTNGTVVFRTDDPDAATRKAIRRLRAAGFRPEEAFVRPLDEIIRIVADVPIVEPAENVYRGTVSFFDAVDDDVAAAIEVPLRSPNDLVEIRSVASGHAWSVCWKRQDTVGNVNAFLERLLRAPVTTRTTGTLERLVGKFSGPSTVDPDAR